MTRPQANGTIPDCPGSPAIWRYRLGAELRRLREEKNLRLEDLARDVDLAPNWLSRLEHGETPHGYVTTMFSLYGLTSPAQRRAMTDMAQHGPMGGSATTPTLVPRSSAPGQHRQ